VRCAGGRRGVRRRRAVGSRRTRVARRAGRGAPPRGGGPLSRGPEQPPRGRRPGGVGGAAPGPPPFPPAGRWAGGAARAPGTPALGAARVGGGVAWGIGNPLQEAIEYDAAGQIVSGTLRDYAPPPAGDVPAVDGFYKEIPATTNPLGLRGLGECGNPGLGAAVANAVCDALRDRGVSITRLPLSAPVVFEAARGQT